MIRFVEKDGEQIITVEFNENIDCEWIKNYKESLINAVQCMSQNNPEMWETPIYYCLELLGELSYSLEQEQKISLCERLNKDRVETLRKIVAKTKYEYEPLTKEETEIKKLMF